MGIGIGSGIGSGSGMLIMDLGGMRRCYCCGLEVLMKVVLWQVWLARIRPPVAERPVPSLMIGGRPTRCHGCVVGLVLGFTIFERSTLQSFHLLSLSLSSHAVRTRCCTEVDEDSHTEWPSLELNWSMPIVSTRLPRYCDASPFRPVILLHVDCRGQG